MPTLQIPTLQIRASIKPNSFNKEKRTVDVVFSTGAGVKRGWGSNRFIETLSMKAGECKMDRLNGGSAPVLDSHSSWGINSQLGVVERAWLENGLGMATLRFSKRSDVDDIVNDIEDGIIQNVSIGYDVEKYERTRAANEGELDQLNAVDWMPYEISMVTIPADAGAGTRAAEKADHTVEIIELNKPNVRMKKDASGNDVAENADEQAILDQRKRDKETTDAQIRQAAADAVARERNRSTEINKIVRQMNLPVNLAETYITENKTVDEARALALEEWTKLDPTKQVRTNANVKVGKEDAEKKREIAEQALYLRTNPGKELKVEDLVAQGHDNATAKALISEVRSMRGKSLLELAESSLETAGIATRGLSKREIAQTALNMVRSGGFEGISDFPTILGNVINRTLRAMYEYQPRTFLNFTRQTTAKDFRPMTKTQLSGILGSFDKLEENAEYKAGKLEDAKEVYSIYKYGKKILISWEAIINDDLDAFTRIPTSIAQKAAQKQSDIVWGIITDNANMGDGNALFSSAHANYTSSGTAIGIDSLSVGRTAFRKQKGLEGDFLNLTPEFLIVCPEKEELAYQYTSVNYVPVDPNKINPEYNTRMKTIVEPRLSANSTTAWYMAASPNMIDTVEFAFLEGEGELFTEQRLAFDRDGLEIKARMCFGAKAIDWRGLYKNAGA